MSNVFTKFILDDENHTNENSFLSAAKRELVRLSSVQKLSFALPLKCTVKFLLNF